MFRLESSGFRTVFLGPSWACFLRLHRDVCFLGRSLVRILADGFGFYRVLSVFGFRPIVKGFEYRGLGLRVHSYVATCATGLCKGAGKVFCTEFSVFRDTFDVGLQI